jgi:hypothetical protein
LRLTAASSFVKEADDTDSGPSSTPRFITSCVEVLNLQFLLPHAKTELHMYKGLLTYIYNLLLDATRIYERDNFFINLKCRPLRINSKLLPTLH